MTGTYLQMITALAAVIGMILVMRVFLKKRQGKPGMMNMVAYQAFGPRKGLAALKMGKEVLLLGVTSTDIRLLRTFDENEFEARPNEAVNNNLKMLRDMKERLHERQ
jgi:flagellar biogenesis protein FliO